MSERPTPRTASAMMEIPSRFDSIWVVPAEVACDLERELGEVLRQRNEAQNDLEEEKKFHHRTHSELIQTQCKLMDLTQAIIDTLEENRHLADGDDCTLAKLKSVIPEWK